MKSKLLLLALVSALYSNVYAQVKILPFGESTTSYWNSYRKVLSDSLIKNNYSFDFIGSRQDGESGFDNDNQGMSGATINALYDWFVANNISYDPKMVLLWAGANDCSWAYKYYGSGVTTVTEMGKLVDKLTEVYPNAEIFVTSASPIADTYNNDPAQAIIINQNIDTYNTGLPSMLATKTNAGKKVHFVDTRGVILKSELSSDGVHPTQVGFDKLAGYWYSAIKPYFDVITFSYQAESSDAIRLYPNPASSFVSIELEAKDQNAEMTISTIAGTTMLSSKLTQTNNNVDISSLPAGSYVLSLKTAETQRRSLFVVTK